MLLDEMAASVHTLLSLLLVLGGCTLCSGRITNQEIGEWKNTLLPLSRNPLIRAVRDDVL